MKTLRTSLILGIAALIAVAIPSTADAAKSPYPRENASAAEVQRHMPWNPAVPNADIWWDSRPGVSAQATSLNGTGYGPLVQTWTIAASGFSGPFTVTAVSADNSKTFPTQTFSRVPNGGTIKLRVANAGFGMVKFYLCVKGAGGTWSITTATASYDYKVK